MPTNTAQNRASQRSQARENEIADDCSAARSEESVDATALLPLDLRSWLVVVMAVFAVTAVAASAT